MGARLTAVKGFGVARSLLRFPKVASEALFDREFAERCKLIELPENFAKIIYSWPVTLPPLVHLRDGTQDLHGLAGLLAVALAIKAKTIFEIGTFTGLTTLALALNLPDATIDTLDLPAGKEGSLRSAPCDENYLPNSRTRRVYADFPAAAARITQHEGDSATFDFDALERKFDLVYIDGAHSYEYVRNDSEAAYRIVSSTGVIVWDDYSRHWPEVSAYLDQHARLGTYCLPGVPRRLAAWFADTRRLSSDR